MKNVNNSSICTLLIIGASGMLGSTLLNYFSNKKLFKTYGIHRRKGMEKIYPEHVRNNLVFSHNILDDNEIEKFFKFIKPDYVINCAGVVKQISNSYDPLHVIPINSILPHKVAKFCKIYNSKLIQVSTDCVFSGKSGMYNESNIPDSRDLYGRTKLLGEVFQDNAITIRTSIIGHELFTSHSLIEWFLKQKDSVRGYKRAIFSGFPTIEIAKILENFIFPNKYLKGLYHLSSDPISKYELLNLVSEVYGKSINLIPDDKIMIDRSLDSKKFRDVTGFKPKSWEKLIKEMHSFEKL